MGRDSTMQHWHEMQPCSTLRDKNAGPEERWSQVRRYSYCLQNASKSALIWSAWVVGIPCG